MRCILRCKVPSLNNALITFALGTRLYIHVLTNLEVTRPQTIAYWQKVFRGNPELGQHSL